MQKKGKSIVSIKKIMSIINSCETTKQLSNCDTIIDNYVNYISKEGVVNPEMVRKRLTKEYKQKLFQLKMLKLFMKTDKKEFIRVADTVLA
jgi:hypothetical protein